MLLTSFLGDAVALRFYNTLTRTLEEFKPIHPGEARVYCCGPTVYNYIHIGNLRAFLFDDLVHRYLKYRGYKVTFVMNITDVDDKTIRDSRKEGKTLKEFTEFYSQAFLDDLRTLRVLPANIMPKATEEIDGMVKMIQTLIERGFAYKNERGDIYFKINAFPEYGALARIDRSKQKQNASGRLARADEYEKENASDFALWKAYDPEDGDVFWETEIGKGRPGWHIECSVMSSKYLGQPFDIHGGGIDLVFPHHTNEIAQSECACGTKLANVWLHNEHLIVNGKKMSKSLGNWYTLRDLLKKGYDPMAVRYELLKTHYRSQLDFREDSLTNNAISIRKFSDLLARLKDAGNGPGSAELQSAAHTAREGFVSAMDDDLNISGALAALHEFVNRANALLEKLNAQDVAEVRALIGEFDSVLGFIHQEQEELSADLQALLEARETARKNKDFKKSDELRDELLKHGIAVKDSAKGTRWERLR
ncbi:MAG: cysteine--tRNA ligase [Deltaproteobacteria bacterium]|nr:cysteine--tRNA ligase [Deltaproteobacteria bacterium]